MSLGSPVKPLRARRRIWPSGPMEGETRQTRRESTCTDRSSSPSPPSSSSSRSPEPWSTWRTSGVRCCSADQLRGGVELLRREADVRVAPDALREDARRLDRRRVVQVADGDERTEREPPGPARARWVVLRLAGHLRDRENRLPDGGVEDRAVARLHARPLRRAVRPDLRRLDVGRQRLRAAAADEEPGLTQLKRSTTPAIAMPKPTHIAAMP